MRSGAKVASLASIITQTFSLNVLIVQGARLAKSNPCLWQISIDLVTLIRAIYRGFLDLICALIVIWLQVFFAH